MKNNKRQYIAQINQEISGRLGNYLFFLVLLASALIFVNYYLFTKVPISIILLACSLSVLSAIAVKMIMNTTINDVIKRLSISVIIVGIYLYVITIRPEFVGISGWAGIFVFLAISVLYINRLFAISLAIASIGFNLMNLIIYPDVIVEVTIGTYLSRIGILMASALVVWYSNLEYERRSNGNLEKLKEISELNQQLMTSKEAILQRNEAIKAATDQLYTLAYFNPLTQLPIRAKLYDDYKELGEALKSNHEIKKAVFTITVHNFYMLQNIHGQEIRDQYLIEIVNALLKITANAQGQLYHIDDDEFVYVLDYYLKDQFVINLAEKMCLVFNNEVFKHIQDYYLSMYIGIAIFPKHGTDLLTLLQKASSTLNHLIETSRSSIMVYGDFIRDANERENGLKAALAHALDEMFLSLQPIVNYKESKVKGFEALIRWDSPEYGMVSPGEFIPYAEENMTIIPIGYWVIEQALKIIKELNEGFDQSMTISINISAIQLLSHYFYDVFETIVLSSGVDPTLVEIELTENILIDSFSDVLDILYRLKKLGIRIALDDFGTGYSSLSYLHRLPIDVLKIDQSFIRAMEIDEENALIKTMIKMAHQLDLLVVAEGVETAEQLRTLEQFQCNYIQGYLFSKPIPYINKDDFISDYKEFLVKLEGLIEVL